MDDVKPDSQVLLYQTPDGQINIDVHLEDETVWLTQGQMAQLFGKAKSTINEHIKNIFSEGELIETEVMKKFGISDFLQLSGNSGQLMMYNPLKKSVKESEIGKTGMSEFPTCHSAREVRDILQNSN